MKHTLIYEWTYIYLVFLFSFFNLPHYLNLCPRFICSTKKKWNKKRKPNQNDSKENETQRWYLLFRRFPDRLLCLMYINTFDINCTHSFESIWGSCMLWTSQDYQYQLKKECAKKKCKYNTNFLSHLRIKLIFRCNEWKKMVKAKSISTHKC